MQVAQLADINYERFVGRFADYYMQDQQDESPGDLYTESPQPDGGMEQVKLFHRAASNFGFARRLVDSDGQPHYLEQYRFNRVDGLSSELSREEALLKKDGSWQTGNSLTRIPSSREPSPRIVEWLQGLF